MSLDIDWSLLSDPALTDGIVDAFNRYLATADRPSFLGPISVSSFDFGSRAPDVEVVGLGDVYPDFLEDDDDDDAGGSASDDGAASSQDSHAHGGGGGGGGRWHQDGASSFAGGRSAWSGAGSYLAPPPPYQDGYGRSGYAASLPGHRPADADVFTSGFGHRAMSSIGALNQVRDARASLSSAPLFPHRPYLAGVYASHSPYTSRVGLGSAHPTPITTPFLSRNPSFASMPNAGRVSRGGSPPSHLGAHDMRSTTPDEHAPPPKPASTGAPSLQLHVRVHHQADVRFSLQTTLLVNHPSPAFMSLPLTLTITQVEVDWHLVLAYQAESEPSPSTAGSRRTPQAPTGRRVHVSILDPLDPYGPPAPGGSTSPPVPHLGEGKTLPVGERLIPHMAMESSIGQEGERVLRNVAKVERCVPRSPPVTANPPPVLTRSPYPCSFVLNLIRKMVVDELVFPNFQSLAL